MNLQHSQKTYRSLAEELPRRNLGHISNAVLFLDKMTRREPVTFMEILKRNFSTIEEGHSKDSKHPKIRHIQDVVSGAEDQPASRHLDDRRNYENGDIQKVQHPLRRASKTP